MAFVFARTRTFEDAEWTIIFLQHNFSLCGFNLVKSILFQIQMLKANNLLNSIQILRFFFFFLRIFLRLIFFRFYIAELALMCCNINKKTSQGSLQISDAGIHAFPHCTRSQYMALCAEKQRFVYGTQIPPKISVPF